MKVWYNNLLASSRFVAKIDRDHFRVGRDAGNDIVLDSPYVADHAAVVRKRDDQWEVMALGMNGCSIGKQKLAPGQRMRFSADDTIRIFPFDLSLQQAPEATSEGNSDRNRFGDQLSKLVEEMHGKLVSSMEIPTETDPNAITDEHLLFLEENIEELAFTHGIDEPSMAGVSSHAAAICIRDILVERLIEQSDDGQKTLLADKFHWSDLISAAGHLEQMMEDLADRAESHLCLSSRSDLSEQMDLLERGFWGFWDQQAPQLLGDFKRYLTLRHLKKQIKDIVFGFGPLEDLLRMPMVSEIMVVDSDRIFIEKEGVIESSGRRFISNETTLNVIERIVSKVGRTIDKSQPLVDARLVDGSRVNAVIAPIAVTGPCLTIRKFPEHRLLMEDLIERNSVSRGVAEFLRACVLNRRNILVAGGTGTGKTTLLNCLSDFIPSKERIVTIEDTAELQLAKDHVVSLETKPGNSEGGNEFTIRDLVRNALRMRPDRIVVGECRGTEALDMLQAMNTGHDGSLTTIHADSAKDAMLRLEVLVQTCVDMPTNSIQRQIVSAVDLVVQLSRTRGGARRVSQVSEVVGIDEMTGGIHTKDIYRVDGEDDFGELRPTGRLPTFTTDLLRMDLIRLENFYL